MENILQYASYLSPAKFENISECNTEGFEDLMIYDNIVFDYYEEDRYLYVFKCEENKYRVLYLNSSDEFFTVSNTINYSTLKYFFNQVETKLKKQVYVNIYGKKFKLPENNDELNKYTYGKIGSKANLRILQYELKTENIDIDHKFPRKFMEKIKYCNMYKARSEYERKDEYEEDIQSGEQYLRILAKQEKSGVIGDVLEEVNQMKKDTIEELKLLRTKKKQDERRYNIINEQMKRKTSPEYKKISLKTRESPDEKTFSTLVKAPVDQFSDRDYEHYQSLWNNPRFGPIIATLIYIGSYQENIPMRALENTWDRMRLDILEISKRVTGSEPMFAKIYKKMVTKSYNCYYENDTYNFLIDFYERGACNCECGSFLAFVLWKMFPEPEKYLVFATIVPGHIYINWYEKKTGVFFKFETTKTVKFHYEINTEQLLEAENRIIFSEQLLAINIILVSSSRKGYSTDLEKRMFNLNFEEIAKIPDKEKFRKVINTVFELIDKYKDICTNRLDIKAIYKIFIDRMNIIATESVEIGQNKTDDMKCLNLIIRNKPFDKAQYNTKIRDIFLKEIDKI